MDGKFFTKFSIFFKINDFGGGCLNGGSKSFTNAKQLNENIRVSRHVKPKESSNEIGKQLEGGFRYLVRKASGGKSKRGGTKTIGGGGSLLCEIPMSSR